jgi:hypothetical protein
MAEAKRSLKGVKMDRTKKTDVTGLAKIPGFYFILAMPRVEIK